jgi:mono/diheme cytochrome c family protein
MSLRGVLAGTLCLLSASLLSCKDEVVVGDDMSPSNIVFPSSNVSYTTHVQPLFLQTCTYAGCHGSDAPPNLVKLTSWGELMTTGAGTGVVIPGEPENSTLVFRIEGRGARMPPTGYPLNQNQISGIRTWIAEGAKNN